MKPESKSHVLMLSTSYPVSEGSVSGLFVGALAKALSEKLDVSVVAPDDERPSWSTETGHVVTRFRYASKRLQRLAHVPGGIPTQLRRNKLYYLMLPVFMTSYTLCSLWRARSADLIQANWAFSSLVGFIVKTLYRIPLVTTLRGEDVRETNGFVSRALLRFSLWSSDAIVVVSEEMKALLLKRYPFFERKCVAILNGVSENFGSQGDLSFVDNSRVLKYVFVGSLIPRKNVAYLLNAFKSMRDAGVDFIFTVIGGGEQLFVLQAMLREFGLAERVQFLGEKSPHEVAEYVRIADVYVSASLHEGRPNSVLEAMSAGCCCVLSDIPGHRELVADGRGVLFSLEEPLSLSATLSSLGAGEIERKGAAAHHYAAQGLSWEGCARQYAELFERVLAGRDIRGVESKL